MKKKINIDRPKIDSAEIASHRDFSNILSQFNGLVKPPFYKTGWFITTVAGVVGIALLTTAIQLSTNTPKQELATISDSAPPVDAIVIDSLKKIEEFNYDEDTPCINPPVKEMDIAFTTYKIDAQLGGTLTHPSGTIITVPGLAFEDLSGNLITGEVQLKFRELNNPIDYMCSGIPMDYDSLGHAMVLESDGMLEIRGFQNDIAVRIAPNKVIECAVATTNQSTRFNAYVLNEESKNWEYKGKPKLVKEDVFINDFTHTPMENSYTQQDLTILESAKDKASLIYANAKASVTYHQKTTPQKPISNGNKNRQFVLDVNPSEFPELATYKNLVFEVVKNDPNFSASVYSEQWDDVRLAKKPNSSNYLLSLFKKGTKKTFSVFPIFNGADLNLAMKKFDKQLESYNKELQNRKTKETEAKTDFEKKLQQWEKAKYDFYEQEMAKKNQVANQAKLTIVAKVLKVERFGVWNLDCGIALPNGAKSNIAFADNKGNKIEVGAINLFEKGKNTIYTYAKQDFKRFKYTPEETNVIIGFLPGDKIGIVNSSVFKNIENKKEHTFEMEIKKITPKLLENLRTEFAI